MVFIANPYNCTTAFFKKFPHRIVNWIKCQEKYDSSRLICRVFYCCFHFLNFSIFFGKKLQTTNHWYKSSFTDNTTANKYLKLDIQNDKFLIFEPLYVYVYLWMLSFMVYGRFAVFLFPLILQKSLKFWGVLRQIRPLKTMKKKKFYIDILY